MKKATKGPSNKTVQALLAKHECPVPFHEVRTRFLGNIATPAISAAPLQIIKDLWGGELPAFDSIDAVNELLDALVQGLWNDLTRRTFQWGGFHRSARAGARGHWAPCGDARHDGGDLRTGFAGSTCR